MKLNSTNVEKMFVDCLFKDKTTITEYIVAEGISTFVFNPAEILKNRENIHDLLNQLPIKFHQDTGGGWSFLQACEDKNGNQWAEHYSMEQLFVLGIAAGYVQNMFPRNVWKILPGGMPYYMVFNQPRDLVITKGDPNGTI